MNEFSVRTTTSPSMNSFAFYSWFATFLGLVPLGLPSLDMLDGYEIFVPLS